MAGTGPGAASRVAAEAISCGVRHTLLVSMVLAAALVPSAAAAAGPASSDPGNGRPLEFLQVAAASGTSAVDRLVDGAGRSVLLRGVNVDGLVDYGTADLTPPYPTSASAYTNGACPMDNPSVEGVVLCEHDLADMRAQGYDDIRLNISWSLLEPTPGTIDAGYLDRISQVVGWARAQRIYVTLDVHGDLWSKYVVPNSTCPPAVTTATRGQDGAPAWATDTSTPDCAPGGVGETSPTVGTSSQKFFADAAGPDGVGLQEHYTHMLAALAGRFVEDPTVVGYDVINEPVPGVAPGAFTQTELFPFYAKVVAAVTTAVPGFRQLFFLEPGGERNVSAARSVFTSWATLSSYPEVVYAPHIYTGVFTAGTATGTPETATSDSDYAAAVGDAAALGVPLWVGEFGNVPQDDARLLAPQYAHLDSYDVGGTIWLWKEHGSWGIENQPFTGSSGVFDAPRAIRVARTYPLLTAGDVISLVEDPTLGKLDLQLTSPAVAAGDHAHGTLVSVPASLPGPLLVEGAASEVVPQASGARDVWLFPVGGAYRLRLQPAMAAALPEVPYPAMLAALGVVTVAVARRRRGFAGRG